MSETVDDITICISTFIRDDLLFRCVDSIRQVHPTIPIIVTDDGRHDISKTERLEQVGVNYIPMSFDSGLSAKRNVMIDAASTPYVALMDDDMIMTEDVKLYKLRSLMDVADLAAGRLYYPSKGRYRDHLANMVFQPRELLLRPTPLKWQIHNKVKYCVTHRTLNCFVAKREVLRAVRWDERLKITYEHLDFFIRLRLAGVPVVYSPDSVFSEQKERNPEYRSYRLRTAEHRKIFFNKWGFSQVTKHPSVK